MSEQQLQQQAMLLAGGSYELIQRRLQQAGSDFRSQLDDINQQRIAAFGNTQLAVLGRVRVRTENNCVPRDLVAVGDTLIFAYNVFIGLKSSTQVSDVFSLHQLQQSTDEQGETVYDVVEQPITGSFLEDSRFVRDFAELYNYYKHATLQHLFKQHGKLFAVFRIGERLSDIRVFRFTITNDQRLEYIDNRGERDIGTAVNHDFEWQKTGREHHSEGRHPHINIKDKVFVETIGGDLTIKVEDNTESGQGIYSEPVDDKTQSLADAQCEYAELGDLVLLKVLPYREKQWRYFIFNCVSNTVIREDAIGLACQSLPDDHGVIFPGGYYLRTGEYRRFEGIDELNGQDLLFHRQLKAPNGEDVLYIFYEPEAGRYALFAYNLIQRQLQNPLLGHGYTLLADGTLLTFHSDNQPERIHPMQIWRSPFCSSEFAAAQPIGQHPLQKIGNADLVRGLSDGYSLQKMIAEAVPAQHHYEQMIGLSRAVFDRYHWLTQPTFKTLAEQIRHIQQTADQALDEFEKVLGVQKRAAQAIAEAQSQQQKLFSQARHDSFKSAQDFVSNLAALKQFKGHLLSLSDVKLIDSDALTLMSEQTAAKLAELSLATAQFLQKPAALSPYQARLQEFTSQTDASDSATELKSILAELDDLSAQLDLLNHCMLDLDIDDSRVRTQILDDISTVYSAINRAKASVEIKRKALGSDEAKAEFAARSKLLAQSIIGGLAQAQTPASCDEQLARLLLQIEELEAQFADYPEFLTDIVQKRDELYQSFESHKQQLIDSRQRRALNLFAAGERILDSVQRRANQLTGLDELNSYFSGDAMVSKLRQLCQDLQQLDEQVKADDLQARFKAIKDQSVRGLRDKQELFADGGSSVQVGRHRFTVNQQAIDLTLLPKDDELWVHLTGTQFFEALPAGQQRDQLQGYRRYWQQNSVAETEHIYRAEYLAAQLLRAMSRDQQPMSLTEFQSLSDAEQLKVLQKFAEPRYQDGYEKGIHDHDAKLIINALLTQQQQRGLLCFAISERAAAQAFWYQQAAAAQALWQQRAQQAALIANHFADRQLLNQLQDELTEQLQACFHTQSTVQSLLGDVSFTLSAEYLLRELGEHHSQQQVHFVVNHAAKQIAEQFQHQANAKGILSSIAQSFKALANAGQLFACLQLAQHWLLAYGKQHQQPTHLTLAAANYWCFQQLGLQYYSQPAGEQTAVTGLLGQHPRLAEQTLVVDYAEFNRRLQHYIDFDVPNLQHYQQLRNQAIDNQRQRLQLAEFKARPLSSFVRNQLIDKVYLPIIGDNLAKQIGALGQDKRSDLMGMLLLISPPGYGKTTLIEYVANRLGMTFVKVNCPAIGHDQLSLDPSQAHNATARKEVEKINLSFEMANNVLLYLDDIQHTNPEFLQKFISLCDGSRRIDGVWQGQSKTYDLRGKKFAVVMAGNPYTESGATFKIPDMLANRADIYNLGDTLAGCEREFALSFIENALTSNRVLAPLSNRPLADFYKLVRIAEGEVIALNELEHDYSQAEVDEITAVLKHLLTIRNTVLKVNSQYIASAAQDDKYRTEPPFKLQGSYRNMNKMAEKVVPVMTSHDIEQLVADHYRGEAQTLSKGSEENLLKLAELRGTLSSEQTARWQQIKDDFNRQNRLSHTTNPLLSAVDELASLQQAVHSIAQWLPNLSNTSQPDLTPSLQSIGTQLAEIGSKLHKTQLSHDYAAQIAAISEQINAGQPLASALNQQLAQGFSGVQQHLAELSGKLNKANLSHDYDSHWQTLVAQLQQQQQYSNDHQQQQQQALAQHTEQLAGPLHGVAAQLAELNHQLAAQPDAVDYRPVLDSLGTQLTTQLAELWQNQPLVATLQQWPTQLQAAMQSSPWLAALQDHAAAVDEQTQHLLQALQQFATQLQESQQVSQQQAQTTLNHVVDTIETSLLPVLKVLHHKVRLDHDVWNKVDALQQSLRSSGRRGKKTAEQTASVTSPLTENDKLALAASKQLSSQDEPAPKA